ncbi:hypothetical protein CN059_30575 [Sinorhizobium medicae]|nr:hypothetical protein CN059_30575 [Sinorhizobium medicae]
MLDTPSLWRGPVSRCCYLFEQACRIIEQANSEPTMIDSWTFVGRNEKLPPLMPHRRMLPNDLAGGRTGVIQSPLRFSRADS